MSAVRDISDILSECLVAIETQQMSVAACLEAYPDRQDELEGLLALHGQLRDFSQAETALPSAEFRTTARASLLDKLEPRQAPASILAPANQLTLGQRLTALLRLRVVRIMGLLALGLCLLVGATGGTIYASEQAIPGQTLYQVKTGVEGYRLSRVDTLQEEVALKLEFADRRVGEMEALVERQDERLLESTAGAYASLVEAVAVQVEAESDEQARARLLASLEDTLLVHGPRLEQLEVAVTEQGLFSAETLTDASAAVNSAQTYVSTGLLITGDQDPISIYETLTSTDQYAAFISLIDEGDLALLLTENEPFTLFVPINALDGFMSMDDEKLRRQRTLYHIGRGDFSAEQLATMDSIEMALGHDMTIVVIDGELFLNGAVQVISADIPATNGTIHFIDIPLTPPSYFP